MISVPDSGIKRIFYASEGQPPVIYWVAGHQPPFEFIEFNPILVKKYGIKPEMVKHGYMTPMVGAQRGLLLSDKPQPNMIAITYWLNPGYIRGLPDAQRR